MAFLYESGHVAVYNTDDGTFVQAVKVRHRMWNAVEADVGRYLAVGFRLLGCVALALNGLLAIPARRGLGARPWALWILLPALAILGTSEAWRAANVQVRRAGGGVAALAIIVLWLTACLLISGAPSRPKSSMIGA